MTFNTTIYNKSKELFIPHIFSFYIKARIRCFKKWKESSCIIFHLVKNIHGRKKHVDYIHKHNKKLPGEIQKFY